MNIILVIYFSICIGLIIFSAIKWLNEKERESVTLKEAREILPRDFVNLAMSHIANGYEFPYEKDGWYVVNCYFTGATLCLDVKHLNKKIEDTITISSGGTFGFFVTPCKRSIMYPIEIAKYKLIKKSIKRED